MRFVLLSLSCFLLAGCTSVPSEAHREWAAFRQVRVGMSRKEVYALVGPSQQTAPCRNGIMHGATVESWTGSRIVEQYRDAPAHMEITFDEYGTVLSVQRKPYRSTLQLIRRAY